MQARSRAIKVLDYAMSGPAGTTACETFVEALGLKTLFSSFMGKVCRFTTRPQLIHPAGLWLGEQKAEGQCRSCSFRGHIAHPRYSLFALVQFGLGHPRAHTTSSQVR